MEAARGERDLGGASWILRRDNLDALRRLPAGFARLVYVGPPFNTAPRAEACGRRYSARKIASERFDDRFEDAAYLDFLLPRIEAAWRCLAADGSLFVHIDYREVQRVKVVLVPMNGKEKTGYPTQKPLGVLNRIARVHTRAGDYVLDAFAGRGTTGEAASANDRRFVLVDSHAGAVRIMRKRRARFAPQYELARTTPVPRTRRRGAPKPVGK